MHIQTRGEWRLLIQLPMLQGRRKPKIDARVPVLHGPIAHRDRMRRKLQAGMKIIPVNGSSLRTGSKLVIEVLGPEIAVESDVGNSSAGHTTELCLPMQHHRDFAGMAEP